MATIDERNVILKFNADTSDLDKGVKKVEATTKGLGASFKQAGATFAGMFALQGLNAVTQGLSALGQKTLSLTVSAEQTRIAFETFLGSASKAQSVIKELNEFSALTPFQSDEVLKAGQALLAFGLDANDLKPTLTALGDIASGTGTNFNELAELFGKAKVQGRLFAEDINQLTGRGIPVIQEFAKQFGVTESEVKGLVESGKIGFKQLETAFQSLTGEGGKFFELTAKQSQSLGGRISTLKDNFDALLKSVGGASAGIVGGFVDFLSGITQIARDYLEVPLSAEYEKETETLFSLQLQLLDVNTTLAERDAIIKKINESYGDYFVALGLDITDTANLATNLDKVNGLLVERAVLQKQIEAVDNAASQALINRNAAIDAEANALTQIAELKGKILAADIKSNGQQEIIDRERVQRLLTVDLLEAKSLEDRVKIITEAASLVKGGVFFGVNDDVSKLNNFLGFTKALSNEAAKSLNDLRGEQEKLRTAEQNVSPEFARLQEEKRKKSEQDVVNEFDRQAAETQKAVAAANLKELEKQRKAREKQRENEFDQAIKDLEDENKAKFKAYEDANDKLVEAQEKAEKAEMDAIAARARERFEAQQKEKEEAERFVKISIELEKMRNEGIKQLEENRTDESRRLADAWRIEQLSAEGLTIDAKQKIEEDYSEWLARIEISRLQGGLKTLQEGSNEYLNLEQEIANAEFDLLKSNNERILAENIKAAEQRIELAKDVANSVLSVANDALKAEQETIDKKITAQEKAVNEALKIAEKGGAEQLQFEENRLQELEAQKERNLEKQRILAAIEIAINNAVAVSQGIVAVTKAFAEGNLISGIATSVALAATIASAVIALRQATADIPAFAEGTEYFDGKGTGTSDSNLVRISRGERVVTAKMNDKYFDTLNEFHNGTAKADYLHALAMGEIAPSMVSQEHFIGGSSYDSKKLERLIEGTNKRLDRMDISVNLDEDGFAASISQWQNKKQRVNSKLR